VVDSALLEVLGGGGSGAEGAGLVREPSEGYSHTSSRYFIALKLYNRLSARAVLGSYSYFFVCTERECIQEEG
jgi:hypothetical protein